MKNKYIGSRLVVFITIIALLTSLMTLGVSAKKDPKPNDKYDELTIITDTLEDGLNAIPYSETLEAEGGMEPYSWIIPVLPEGLSVDSYTGVISGIPVQPAGSSQYLIHVSVTDAEDTTVTKDLSITVHDNHVRIIYDDSSMPTLPEGYINQNYSYTLTARDGAQPYTWSSGGLPAGLQLDPQNGTISGIPTVSYEDFYVSITVTEANGLYSDSLTFKLSIDEINDNDDDEDEDEDEDENNDDEDDEDEDADEDTNTNANAGAGADANPAAPAIAGRLLKDAGIKPTYIKDGVRGNYIHDISELMTEEAVFNGVEKTDREAYETAVKTYLISIGLDL